MNSQSAIWCRVVLASGPKPRISHTTLHMDAMQPPDSSPHVAQPSGLPCASIYDSRPFHLMTKHLRKSTQADKVDHTAVKTSACHGEQHVAEQQFSA